MSFPKFYELLLYCTNSNTGVDFMTILSCCQHCCSPSLDLLPFRLFRYGLKPKLMRYATIAILVIGNLERPISKSQSKSEVPWEDFVSCVQDGGTLESNRN